MSTDKKTCPECSKELPVTASNCKYCGAALGESHAPSFFDSMGQATSRSVPPRPSGMPVSKLPPPPSTFTSTPPPPPQSGSASADEDDWIPDADEASALINLDQLPLQSEGRPSDNEVTNPSISRAEASSDDETVVAYASDDQTVVSSASRDKSREMSDNASFTATDHAVAQVFGDSPADSADSNVANSKVDDALVDDAFKDVFKETASSAGLSVGLNENDNVADTPSGGQNSSSDSDEALDEDAPLFSDDSSGELSALMKMDSENSDEIDIENSEAAIVTDKSGAPVPPRPSTPSPRDSVLRPPSPSAIPRPSQTPAPSLPRPSAAPSPVSESDKTNVMPRPYLPDSTPITADMAPTGPSIPAVARLTSRPPTAMDSATIPPDSATANTGAALGSVDELLYSTPPDAYDPDGLEGGNSIKKIVIVSAAAFIITLAIALIFIFATDDSEKITIVDSESVEIRQEAIDPADTKIEQAAIRTVQETPKKVAVEETAPKKVAPVSPNCLPLDRYFKQFPWKNHFEQLLAAQHHSKICELFGSSSQTIASALSDMTMVGPTGYDWITDGGRIEVYPGGKIGSREPSLEFLFSGDQLFKIKAKYRGLKIGRRAGADALQKIFKKESETLDHLGRQAISFDEQDMTVKLLEEQWYGQTLRTLEFSSVQLNEKLAGHIQKLESLEAVYKTAEAAYFGWKFDEAMKGYEEVNTMAPGLGAAIVKRGLISLRSDDFGTARALAESALKTSRQDEVKAEAKGILAVNALRNGDKEGALKMLFDAKKLAPANTRFSSDIEQLESGNYTVQTIAQTAARLACIDEGKSKASEIGVLARGFFTDKALYLEKLKAVKSNRQFKETRDNLMIWECK